MKPDLIIGGAGIFGLTIAEQAASAGYKVKIVELKNKIGGNMASHIDEQTGIEIHTYGSHIFHTNNEKVWEYVNRFTEFTDYRHRVRTTTATGEVIPLPFGLATFSAFYGRAFTPALMRRFMKSFPQGDQNFEEVAIASVGKELYEAVIKGYTAKQWQQDPKNLPASTIKRLPVRFTWDDGYFTDKYQGIPKDGYQTWMERMVANPLIEIEFETNLRDTEINAPLVFTGKIDEYFDYAHGPLGYRAVDFIDHRPDTDDFQGCAVMNYADPEVPYTRIHEYKHYRPDVETNGTIIHYEFSRDARQDEIGAYPINTQENRDKLLKYREDAKQLEGVWFGGRLGSYAYLDMHAAIASALTMWQNEIKPHLEGKNDPQN